MGRDNEEGSSGAAEYREPCTGWADGYPRLSQILPLAPRHGAAHPGRADQFPYLRPLCEQAPVSLGVHFLDPFL